MDVSNVESRTEKMIENVGVIWSFVKSCPNGNHTTSSFACLMYYISLFYSADTLEKRIDYVCSPNVSFKARDDIEATVFVS